MTKEKIEKSSVEEIFELTPTQKGMLFHHLEDLHSNSYNVQISLMVDGHLDPEVLRRAFRHVQGQNDVLRSVFRWDQISKPIQIVLKDCPFDLAFDDLTSLPSSEFSRAIESAEEGDRNARFNLEELPLRLRLIKISGRAFILTVTYHHILLDGWSNAIMLKELFSAYKELSGKKEATALNKISYSIVRKGLDAKSTRLDGSKFWGDYLQGYEIVPLLNEYGNRADETFAYKRIRVTASGKLLKKFAKNNNVTLASVIYASYGVLLQRYTNTSDVVFGTTVASRDVDVSGMENVIGSFINTIPLRVQETPGKTLGEVVSDVNKSLIARNDFHHSSYFSIKKAIGLRPTENLFDTVVVIENYPIVAADTDDKLNIKLRSYFERTDIPLLITALIEDDLKLDFSFNAAKVDESFIKDLANHLSYVIESIASRPQQLLQTFSILDKREQERLIGFNNSGDQEPDNQTIVELFEAQVSKSPERVAVVDKFGSITYNELNEKSNQLARYLVKTGIKEQDVVGILLSRRSEMLVCMMAVLKANCAYMPIDPGYPIGRITHMIGNSGTKVVLTEEKLKNVYSQLGDIETVDVTSPETYKSTSKKAVNKEVTGSGLAYVIYTSGSTGLPKGIMIEHRNVVNYVHAIAERLGKNNESSMLCLTTMSFDIFVTETIYPLLNGLKIVIADESAQRDAEALTKLIADHKIDIVQITPSHLTSLLSATTTASINTVKTFLVGGEAFPDELLHRLQNVHQGRIYNMYGPTETTVWSAMQDLTKSSVVNIGTPIRNTTLYVIDRNNNLQPVGVPGELVIGGSGLARGYWNNEELTTKKFIDNPFVPGERIYKTGDLAVLQQNGSVKLLGRIDDQVKVRGFRIELGEIENILRAYPHIDECAVVVRGKNTDKNIVAYYVAASSIDESTLKKHLSGSLPEYMMPAYFVRLGQLPRTPNGKLDRKALPEPELTADFSDRPAAGETEARLVQIWSDLLGHNNISINRNFFDIGGDSLKLISATGKIKKAFNKEVSVNDLFANPTISSLAVFLEPERYQQNNKPAHVVKVKSATNDNDSDAIAVIGLDCRFPGAANAEEFWENLRLANDGITRKENSGSDSKVYAKGFLDNADLFDAGFFNYTPGEAIAMDPQIRVFHECVYHALENAGYNPFNYEGRIGLYGGATINPYYGIRLPNGAGKDWIEKWDDVTFSDKDFLCPRVSYKLNLKGPSITISTACSTSLVAVDKACNELLSGQCDIAVAGGVSITIHDNDGYYYHKDMIMSSDGRCRAFDRRSSGTVGGNGAGVVVLKKLSDALRDHDFIHAVIKGTATNNDGGAKVGFTAPSITGQAEVIKMALNKAGVSADTISYVETHGTGTALGDPIEIAALNKAFDLKGNKSCAIGSVKTNIGHLDAAAGVAGLIKTILALKNKQIPESLYFEKSNPDIDFAGGPFYVNAQLTEWKTNGSPRRAGVSSFGIGGTNAHVIVEEAPSKETSQSSGQHQVLTFSARSEAALRDSINKTIEYLQSSGSISLADVAFTLQVGREHFDHRAAVCCNSKDEAVELLKKEISKKKNGHVTGKRPVVFMFPGQGSQYVNMGRGIYEREKTFRQAMDECFALYTTITGEDLKGLIFNNDASDQSVLDELRHSHPSLFIVGYALSKLLIGWGIRPDYMIGHSIGEYVAACVSGVFTLEDAMKLVVKRSQLIQGSRIGKMLGVPLNEKDLPSVLSRYPGISLAAVNARDLCVVSGDGQAIDGLKKYLDDNGYTSQLVRASHASHSHMMDEVMAEYARTLNEVTIRQPRIPFISNLTGRAATWKEISDPQYWVKHLRNTVLFNQGVSALLEDEHSIFIEVGPGNILGTFVRSNENIKKSHRVIDTVRHEHKEGDDLKILLTSVAKLWTNGVAPEWQKLHEDQSRGRVPLPGYPFEQVKFKIKTTADTAGEQLLSRGEKPSEWFHTPSWESTPRVATGPLPKKLNLIFADGLGIARSLADKLISEGQQVIEIRQGHQFKQVDENRFEIALDQSNDYRRILSQLTKKEDIRILFAWGLKEDDGRQMDVQRVKDNAEIFYYSLLNIAKAISDMLPVTTKVELISITDHARNVLGEDLALPEKALLFPTLRVIEQEHANVSCRNIDVILAAHDGPGFVNDIWSEIRRPGCTSVALRHRTRFEESYKSLKLPSTQKPFPFIAGEVYLVTGGAGGFGMTFTKRITQQVKGVKFILLGRSSLNEQTINEISEIGNNGGVVRYFAVDIANEQDLREVIERAQEELGQIRGVIHAAGIPDFGGIIYNRTREATEKVFAAKIDGTVLLNKILVNNKLDFFVLCSSISSAVPAEGQVAYAAANNFLNAFANYNTSIGIPTYSIGWCAWREVGFATTIKANSDEDYVNSISPTEGFEILIDAIGSGIAETMISKIDVPQLIARLNSKHEDFDIEVEAVSADRSSSVTLDRLTAIWKKVLGIAEIEPGDDFFEIGGNSLKALTIIGRIRHLFKADLSIKEFFAHSTLESLSSYLASGKEDHSVITTIVAAETKDRYVLSSAQKRLYFIYEFNKSSIAYNVPVAYKVEGKLDVPKLEKAFKLLIDTHESLRTSIQLTDNEPFQVVHDKVDFGIEILTNGTIEAPGSFVRPFDLSRAPLLRVGVSSVSDNEHYLFIDMHHIVADGMSEAILMRSFAAAYNNEPIATTRVQYKDYAEWQQQSERREAVAAEKTFWTSQFDDVTLLSLPTDFERPSVMSFKGTSVSFELGSGETSRLRSLADRERSTLFMVLLAAFNVLLSKLSGKDDIIVGTPVANRQQPELEEIIGMFVNTLALRNFPKGELRFNDFLAEVKSRTLACFDNQAFQYEDLIEELKINRDVSRNALFTAALVLHNTDPFSLSIPGLGFKRLSIEGSTAKFDIQLEVAEIEDKLQMKFEYCTDLFERTTIERFIKYFKGIVNSIADNPEVLISEVDYIPAGEKKQLLDVLTRTSVNYPENKTVIALFEEQVAKTPDNAAVKFYDTTVTYQELDEKATAIGILLHGSGVRTGDLVGLMMDRSIDTIAGMLGILKAGGAYVPIDIDYPEARIKYLIDDSGVKVVLTTAEILNKVSYDVHMVTIEDAGAIDVSTKPLIKPATPSDLCYVIYTSGTTGNPKGVMVENRNVVRLLFNDEFQFDFGPHDTWTMFHSHCFDFSVWEIFGALLYGGKVVVIPKLMSRDPAGFLKVLRKEKVTVLNQTPSAFYSLIQQELTDESQQKLSLRYVIFGGEALSPGMLKNWHVKYPEVALINMYGITETTVHVTYKEIGEREMDRGTSNIGGPIPTLSVYLLDQFQKPVPRGVIGEMYVGGPGVTRGYLGKEELTAKKFVHSPFNSEEILFRSGDLARLNKSGDIEYLGRIDDQVQLRGFRIELGEIKSQLNLHEKVRESVVMAPERDGNMFIAAYYVADEPLPAGELRAHLSARLPEHMVPSYFIYMEKIPLTSNGKVDSKSLPEPVVEETKEYTGPSDELEQKLVDIWSTVLKIDRKMVSTTKSFFELGGDSIKIVQLNALINKTLSLETSIPDLFRYPSIRAFTQQANEKVSTQMEEKKSKEQVAEMQGTLDAIFK